MASVNDKGAFTPAGFSPKVRVSSADTTEDFLDNKVVVSGSLGKEILNPSADEELQIRVDVVGAAWVTRETTAASSFAALSTNRFLPIGTQSSPVVGEVNVADAQFRCPRAVTITAIYVRLGTLLTGIETLDINININGTTNTTFTVNHDSGSGELASATGEIPVDQDDLICFELTFGGGLGSTNINSLSVAYLVQPEAV